MKTQTEKIRENWLKLTQDPVFNILLRKSSITQRQVEVLLFDVAAEEQGLRLTYEERAKVLKLSKGAYARIRKQAMSNITKALFTVILSSYLGILKLPKPSWVLEIGELLQEGDAESLKKALSLLREEGDKRYNAER